MPVGVTGMIGRGNSMECPYRVDTECDFAACCNGSVCEKPEEEE